MRTADDTREKSDGRFAIQVDDLRVVELPTPADKLVTRGVNEYNITTAPVASWDRMKLRWAGNLRNENGVRQISVKDVTITDPSGTVKTFCGARSPLRLTHTFWHAFNSTCTRA